MAATTNGSVSMQTDFDKLGDGANINLRNFNKENPQSSALGTEYPSAVVQVGKRNGPSSCLSEKDTGFTVSARLTVIHQSALANQANSMMGDISSSQQTEGNYCPLKLLVKTALGIPY